MSNGDDSKPWAGREPLRRLVRTMYDIGKADIDGIAAELPAVIAGELWRDVPTFTGRRRFDTFADFCAYTRMPATELMDRLWFTGHTDEAAVVAELIGGDVRQYLPAELRGLLQRFTAAEIRDALDAAEEVVT